MISVADFLFKHLSPIAKTFPLNSKDVVKLPYITYSIDSVEAIKVTSGKVAYKENFVTITVYADEYDKSDDLATQVIDTLDCLKELNIMGTSFTSKTNERIAEPVDSFSVVLDYSIYER